MTIKNIFDGHKVAKIEFQNSKFTYFIENYMEKNRENFLTMLIGRAIEKYINFSILSCDFSETVRNLEKLKIKQKKYAKRWIRTRIISSLGQDPTAKPEEHLSTNGISSYIS